MDEGELQGNRTDFATLVCPYFPFRHNMQEGFPLITGRKLNIKPIAVELEGFLHGITSKKWYKDRGCNLWNEWANPLAVDSWMSYLTCDTAGYWNADKTEWKYTEQLPDRKEIAKKLDDLGPIYGYQWVRFNNVYDENDDGCVTIYNQVADVIEKLKNNPTDRRMICMAWNPVQTSRMALPPCAIDWTVVPINGTLHMGFHMRSSDVGRGLPSDIASHAILMKLLCKAANMKEGYLSGMLDNCHIYVNQVEPLQKLLEREPKPLPQLEIKDNIDGGFDVFKWTHADLVLDNYIPHPHIDMGQIAV